MRILEEQKKKLEKGAMIYAEERATGSVPTKVYWEYLKSGGVGLCIITWTLYAIC
jgi:hypothetical protein